MIFFGASFAETSEIYTCLVKLSSDKKEHETIIIVKV